MKLILASVGRLKGGPEAQLVEDYAHRIRQTGRSLGFPAFELLEVEAPRGLEGEKRQEREAELLANATLGAARRILLDEKGAVLTSEAFANQLGIWRDTSVGDLALLIGGSDGLARSLRQSGDLMVAFGAMTWPHKLARVMACEQVYRAMTILAGHPYHRA